MRLAVLVAAFAGVILLLGITQLRSAAIDTYPEFTAPSVRVAGAFAKPFVIAYAVALGTSMVVALTLIPAMAIVL
ncbi:MAG TPA: hypothetical protein VNW94_29975, partial [Streptosporangiaceae bacterium]|nr:hypothetical protein [Streptosporangiaceae bacterium]